MTTMTKAQVQAELEATRKAFDEFKQTARSAYADLLRKFRALEAQKVPTKFGVKAAKPKGPREIPTWQQERKAQMAAAKAAAMAKS